MLTTMACGARAGSTLDCWAKSGAVASETVRSKAVRRELGCEMLEAGLGLVKNIVSTELDKSDDIWLTR